MDQRLLSAQWNVKDGENDTFATMFLMHLFRKAWKNNNNDAVYLTMA